MRNGAEGVGMNGRMGLGGLWRNGLAGIEGGRPRGWIWDGVMVTERGGELYDTMEETSENTNPNTHPKLQFTGQIFDP